MKKKKEKDCVQAAETRRQKIANMHNIEPNATLMKLSSIIMTSTISERSGTSLLMSCL